MSKSRFPVTLLKGAIGLGLAVLLIAPVAVLWSNSEEPLGGGKRQPVQMRSGQGEDMPAWWLEQEVAWLKKTKHKAYGRSADFWPAEMGNRQLGQVDLSKNRSPYVIHLPGGKGSFDIKEGAPRVPAGLMKAKNGPVRASGDYFIAQPGTTFLHGKSSKDVRQMIAGLGDVEIVGRVPNNAFLLRVKGQKTRQNLLSSTDFQFVGPYHPAYKLDRRIGKQALLSPERASSGTLSLTIRSHKDVDAGDLAREIGKAGATILNSQEGAGRVVASVEIDKRDLFKLARVDDIYLIQEKGDLVGMTGVTASQVEMGRFLDPRQNGGFVRPFFSAGIDGGGQYATDPNNVPAGCNSANVPFDPATGTVDPDCYEVAPQFLGLVDNGLSLDSAPLAHSQTSPCIGACGTATQITGVGATHRKVEMYVRSRDLDNNGVAEDATAEGDGLSCDSITSGATTHGHIVASVMLGNSTDGQFGLGVTFDNSNASNIFSTFFNDENERNIPADGQAAGARLLFIDARGTGVSVGGPPPCATNLLSDVDVGTAVLDDVEALAYRRDLSLANSTLHPRGAKIIVLPFGYQTPFNTDIDDGHGTYAGDAEDLDEFLFANRRVLITVASGNDGANENSGADIDPFVNLNDPNAGFTVEDLQIQDLASGKNTTVVGMNQTSTLDRDISATDQTEFMVNASSKGPATVNSLRIAPRLVAPGNEPSRGGGGFEGQYSADFFDSIWAPQSFDDEQDTGEGVETVRHNKNSGSSFSAGLVGGAAAQAREWFSEGYYPSGDRNPAAAVTDISGTLVNALLAASANFLTSGPLIASCPSAPCIEQGWGKVELANILPLSSYSDSRRPNDKSNSPNSPTLPRNLLVVDEYFDGGLGIGVISPGEIKEFEFTVDHGGSSLRSVLHWYDAPGELLVNDLDLEVIDGDYDNTEGWDTAFGYPTPGSGMCSSTAFGSVGSSCGYCGIAGLDNPDAAYFDPTGFNGYVRRFLGNVLVDRQQFSRWADCTGGTCDLAPGAGDGVCDLNAGDGSGICTSLTCSASSDPNAIGDACTADADCDGPNAGFQTCVGGVNAGGACTAASDCDSPNPAFGTCDSGDIGAACSRDADCGTGLDTGAITSQADDTNNVEKVHVYSFTGYDFLSNTRGAMSEGFYKAVVKWTNTNGGEVGAPNAPCVSAGPNGVIDTALDGNDVLLTANGKEYIGSGVDNSGTVGVDEAACGSYSGTLGGDDVQLVGDGNIAQPFSLVISGALSVPGVLNGTSSVSLDKEAYDCSDTSLRVAVTENEPSTLANFTGDAKAGTVIEVLDSDGNVVDSESGFTFTAGTGTTGQGIFKAYEELFNRSELIRVQSIQNLSRNPVANNGMVEVRDGYTVRASYTDPDDSSDTDSTTAKVECTPLITPGYVLLAVENKKQKFIGGGCDLGRSLALRGDFNLDAGERVLYQVQFNNHSNGELRGLHAILSCSNDAASNPGNDPCQYLTIIDPDQNIGRVPFGRESAAAWNIDVDEAVVSLASADRVVFLDVAFTVDSTDDGGEIATQTFRFREALHADNDIRFWNTDYPTGGKKFIDVNLNGLVDAAEFNNGGRFEGREIRTYESWFGTPNEPLADPSGTCAGGCIPFKFDLNDGGFQAILAADSLPGSGFPTGAQGWGYGTGGGCGWQTQTGGAKGVWHAGDKAGPVNAPGGGCGTYILPSDPTDGTSNNFVNYFLRSPVFFKVGSTPNSRGFVADVRTEHLSWNGNEDLIDNAAGIIVEIDMALPDCTSTNPEIGCDGGVTLLGDSYSYRPVASVFGPKTSASNSAGRFGPRFDGDGIPFNSDDVGVAAPLAAYSVENFVERPLMPFPATDADPGTAGFQSDERIQDGGNICADASIPVGSPCRKAGFTTPEGPVRNLFLETGASYEDFRGASGDSFAFEFSWNVNEGGGTATGYTVDDVLWEWSEQKPEDQTGFVGGDCTLDNLGGLACTADTCVGGPRNGLFCNNTVDDCRDVVAEGACSGGTCTNGLIGKGCSADNDCDLGRCVAGNTNLGCEADTDCNRATNDCDAIPYRISALNAARGSAYNAAQCANISFNRNFTYDCTGSLAVTVQDETPGVAGTIPGTCSGSVCTAGHVGDGCSVNADCDVRQVTVNARTPAAGEPLGEDVLIDETASGSGVFTGDVPFTSLQNLPGTLFVASNPAENTLIFVSYFDENCDQDRDGETGEGDFRDIDGDGVNNFGADDVQGDQSSSVFTVEGTPASDDDSCFNGAAGTDVFNPAGQGQIDLNGDGLVTGSDCVVDANHNLNGQCDWDSDGVGDICDNCPKVANGGQVDSDGDGIGDACEVTDIDGDGVLNTVDSCPTIANAGDQATTPGTECNETNDADGDLVPNNVDNCPTARGNDDDNGPFECNGSVGFALCYNPDQRDQDQDGIGDLCDEEDLDGDKVQNALDNCATVYNPADPVFQVQTDSDGDGLGDDQSGIDSVGACVGGPTVGKACAQIGTGVGCGTGGFCVQSSDPYCDYDSTDDNSNGVPDDLVQFTTEINCGYSPSDFGAPQAEIANVGLAGVAVTDDGTADWICVSGDPNPNNNIITPESCPAVDPNGNIIFKPNGETLAETDGPLRAAALGVTGTTLDIRCDTTLGAGDGDCEPVPDGIIDPGELASVQLDLSNSSQTATGANRTLTNVEVGILTGSATVGCVTKGETFVGTFPGGGVISTPPGGLQFVLDPAKAISTASAFATASFTVTVRGDGIQGNAIPQTFSISGDSDQITFPQIASNCGNGAGLAPAHSASGVLCEDFDTDRNSNSTYDFTRRPTSVSQGQAQGDPGDDVLGTVLDGGPVPQGVSGQICSGDAAFGAALATCFVVPGENDWHLHSPVEGCDDDDSYDLGDTLFGTTCAPEGTGRAHSGLRSMHMGRHLNATDTLWDTYRMRQTSAFVLDAVHLGTASTLEFWQIIRVCDDLCVNAGDGGTTAGGQIHIALLNGGTGNFDPWERISATQNGYGSLDQEIIVICEFDPGDDKLPPLNETMCGGSPQWSEQGDVFGSNTDCVTDTDGAANPNGDCGQTTNRTVDGSCDWVTDPACGSFLEPGAGAGGVGPGLWARTRFDLASFAGRTARLRWIFQGGGGWGFGESRSFLEPEPGFSPYFAHEQDMGWYVDDIKLSDLRTSGALIEPDPLDGLTQCPTQGDPGNCGGVNIVIAGAASGPQGLVRWVTSQVSGTSFVLDARQSTATPDGVTGFACASGILEFRMSELDDAGNVVRVLKPFSPGGDVPITQTVDTSYRVDARCSSDTACVASSDVRVLSYPGDGREMAPGFVADGDGYVPDGVNGLVVTDCDLSNNTTLSWEARPQPPGVSGYDVFECNASFGGSCTGGGPGAPSFSGACAVPDVAQAGTGATVSVVRSCPAAGTATLWAVGHSSMNGLALAPLGFDPVSGEVVLSTNTCP